MNGSGNLECFTTCLLDIVVVVVTAIDLPVRLNRFCRVLRLNSILDLPVRKSLSNLFLWHVHEFRGRFQLFEKRALVGVVSFLIQPVVLFGCKLLLACKAYR
ncbi:hypothetical protein DFH09DRAFT_1336377 [Mycena vulgaris]|nr:hypothetical protein DFH09DRAFT_1337036 [Mycena vulgaris]KAJ6499829.1 hypothetical protein DFH09DRAFT_1336377 [Mycena vulgaris]